MLNTHPAYDGLFQAVYRFNKGAAGGECVLAAALRYAAARLRELPPNKQTAYDLERLAEREETQ